MSQLLWAALLSLFSLSSIAANCNYNSWDIAYAHLDNKHSSLFRGVKYIEPDRPGPQKVRCPDLEKFIGSYQSNDKSCSDTKIESIDNLSLHIDGFRNFIGVNAGIYIVSLPQYSPFLKLTTTATETSIIEQWTLNDQVIAKYEISKNDIRQLFLKISSRELSKTCLFQQI